MGLAVASAVVVWLFSGFYTVDAQQRGVLLRFGAVTGVAQPGLGWHMPWPVGEVMLVNVTKLRQASTRGTLVTRDFDLVEVGSTVQFRVSSARAYLFNVANPDDTLAQATKTALRRVVAEYDIDAVLGHAQQEIGVKVKQQLQHILDTYQCGLQVTDLTLNDVQPPQPVQAAFADGIKAQDDARKLRATAEEYAQERLPQANEQADKELAAAQAYSENVMAQARGERARFDAVFDEYRKAPEATRERLYADTLRDILQGNRVVLVSGSAAHVNVNVTQSGSPASPEAPADDKPAAPGPAATPSAADDTRSSRSRDRTGGAR